MSNVLCLIDDLLCNFLGLLPRLLQRRPRFVCNVLRDFLALLPGLLQRGSRFVSNVLGDFFRLPGGVLQRSVSAVGRLLGFILRSLRVFLVAASDGASERQRKGDGEQLVHESSFWLRSCLDAGARGVKFK